MFSRILLVVLSVLGSCNGSKHLGKTQDDIRSLFSDVKDEYIIDGVYNLNNDTIFLPEAAIVFFESGAKVENGVLIGNNSVIQSKSKEPIFKNVSFDGTFIGEPIAEWFSLIYNKKTDNSFELNAALDLAYHSSIKKLKLSYSKVLYVRSNIDNTNVRDYLREGTVEIKSNVCLDLNHSTIKCLPNSAKQYNILFSRESNNITIRNGTIHGDLKDHSGNKGEWGYGIELQGVHGFLLEDLECCYCWGDGINIQVSSDGDGHADSQKTRDGHCLDGVIRNVNCHQNRRQGISVEGIIGLEITNSSFCSTEGTSPQSGLDLEPYSSNNLASNILIKKCVFDTNAYSGILMMSMDNNISNVLIDSCYFSNNHFADMTIRGNDVTIRSCPLHNIKLNFVGDCEDINVFDSKFSKIAAQDFTEGHHVRNVVFSNCSVMISNKRYAGFEEDTKLSDCDMVFNNCVFDFSKAIFEKGIFAFSLASPNRYTYNNCSFDMGNNTLRVAKNQMFNNCDFSVRRNDKNKTIHYLKNNISLFSNCVVIEKENSWFR